MAVIFPIGPVADPWRGRTKSPPHGANFAVGYVRRPRTAPNTARVD